MRIHEARDIRVEVELPGTNLWIKGWGSDVNGNKVIRLSFPSGRAFSIQMNGTLPKTYSILGRKQDGGFSDDALAKIKAEVVDYIKNYGSGQQKQKINVYREGVNRRSTTLSEAMNYDQERMEQLGFNLEPGGRYEAWNFATEELGISPQEIIGKIDDDTIYNAIHYSLEVMGYYSDMDGDDMEEGRKSIVETRKQIARVYQLIKNARNRAQKG